MIVDPSLGRIRTINPQDLSTADLHGLLLGTVTPRPIAFASTVDAEGRVNLSPFSYFNVFSTNPAVLVFAPARRVRDNTTKHTLDNVQAHPEVVINLVNYALVQQMSLASTEYPHGVNEFAKAGLTEEPSLRVQPPRVAESPVSFECKVLEVKALGENGGAGSLVICQVLLAHFREEIFTDDQIDPRKLDIVARMGANWYCRVNGEAMFEVPKPGRTHGIGVDQMPEAVRVSPVLTGNDLGLLGGISQLPDAQALAAFRLSPELGDTLDHSRELRFVTELDLHRAAQQLLARGEVEKAWLVLMQSLPLG